MGGTECLGLCFVSPSLISGWSERPRDGVWHHPNLSVVVGSEVQKANLEAREEEEADVLRS